MPRRYPPPALPRVWLMTDERLGDDLWTALRRLPRGGGIVFRHHATEANARRKLYRRIARLARSRGLLLILAGDPSLGGAAGRHNARRRAAGVRTAAVHDRAELRRARMAGVDLVFVSPVFATRSHPGGAVLGVRSAASLARAATMPAIALGGMDARRFRRMSGSGFHGWAAIDAWTGPDQKRKAVPT